MRKWWRRVRPAVLATIIYAVAKLIGATLRIKVIGEEKILKAQRGKIIAGWHGRTFLAAVYFRNRNWWALISRSQDGEMQNHIFRKFGFQTIRGSTARGGARAAAECARILRDGGTFVFTPDGPRGPSQKVQRGILWLAQKGNASIFPAAASARPRKLFRSWDRYMIPLPFAKSIIIIGDPITISPDDPEDKIAATACNLERQLNALQDMAEKEMGY